MENNKEEIYNEIKIGVFTLSKNENVTLDDSFYIPFFNLESITNLGYRLLFIL